MRGLQQFVGRFLVRLQHHRTRDIALWQISMVVMFLLGIALFFVYPYVTTPPPESNTARTARELYEYAARIRAEFRGEALPTSFSWLTSTRGFLFHHVARVVAGLFGFAVLVAFVFTVRACGDLVGEWFHRTRVRIWDTYGGQVHQQGWFARLFAGSSPPPGARPPAQPATPGASGGSTPLTRRAFALSELFIEILLPAAVRLIRGH